jgi:DNA ligase (NAD+)
MDIDGVGERVVERLFELGLVVNMADLYNLSADDLLPLEGFQEKSVDNMFKALAASGERPFHRVLFALGIRHVGSINAQLLADNFGDIDSLMAADAEQIAAVEGIGPVIAASVLDFFNEPHNVKTIDRLREAGLQFKAESKGGEGSHPLAGKRFVLTGTLSTLSRSEAKEKIEALGGKVSGSVGKSTDFVVLGDNPGSKADKARELEKTVLSEDEFIELLEN